jgi:host factor-I protein
MPVSTPGNRFDVKSLSALGPLPKAGPPPGQEGKTMEKPAQNIQEAFLNNARKDKTFLTIYLMSGVKLSGRIKSFDKYSLILESNSQEQLIFKHAISTVVISKAGHAFAPAQVASAAAAVPAGAGDPQEAPES